MVGDSSIEHVIDLLGVIIQAEQCPCQQVIREFGASHAWSVVNHIVCCFDWLFFLLITLSGARILPCVSLV